MSTAMNASRDWGLYVHIPFCPYKCEYCDFVAVAAGPLTRRWVPRYLQALVRELENAGWEGPAATMFYGGGTPTLVDLADLHPRLGAQAALPADGEATAEANPGTVTRDSLRAMRRAGINRLSLGLQASQDRLLAAANRRHTYAEFLDAYRWARDAGFDNVNVDLMYGLPGQTLKDWQETVAKVVDMRPEHISAYGLQLEEGTVLYARRPPLPDEDAQAEMYEAAGRELSDYEHYEISNWSLPGRQCAHNLLYWRNRRWLGLGVGAASQDETERWANTSRLAAYCAAVEAGRPAPAREREARDPASDGLILGLRLREGVPQAEIDMARFDSAIAAHVDRGWLEWRDGRLCLTDAGQPVANRVWADLL